MRGIARRAAAAALTAAMTAGLAACAAPQGGSTDMEIHTHGLTPGEESARNRKSDPSMPANLHEATAAELVGRWKLARSVADGKESSEAAEGSLELTDDGNGVMVADGHDGSVTWSKGRVVAAGAEMGAFIEREQGDLYLRKGNGWDSYLVFVSLEEGRRGTDATAEGTPQGESPAASQQGGGPVAEGQGQPGEAGGIPVEQLGPPPVAASGTGATELLGARTDPDKPFTGRWLATAVHGREGFEYRLYDGLRGLSISPDGKAQMDVAGKVTEGKWSTADNRITITDGSGSTTLATGATSAGSGIDVTLTEKSGARPWQDTVHLERG